LHRHLVKVFCFRARARFANDASALRHAHDVQNQRHSAIAHDAGTRKRLYPFDLFAQRLHDDFFGIIDLVNDKTKRTPIRLQNNDVYRTGRILSFFATLRFQIQFAPQMREGQ
jgi:hypothetical protein